MERVLPAIRALAAAGLIVSIDTRHADTMREAIAAGARIVNDVSALADDPRSAEVVAELDCPVVLMHRRGDFGDHECPGRLPGRCDRGAR